MKSRRELIILGLAGLAVIYLVFDLIIMPSYKPKKIETAQAQNIDIKTLLAEMSQYAKKDGSVDNILYTMSRADLTWPRDPFLYEDLASAASVEGQKTKFNYTGFVMLGPKRLAIVNGIEYQIGETIAGADFTVKAINPNDVVLENLVNRSRLSIPIQE
jgi:hypothetical protein